MPMVRMPAAASCACGCGTPIPPRRDNGTWRYVPEGQTAFYVHGHNPIGKGGPGHHLWKGGRIRNRGYILLYMPGDPRADLKGYVPEHRVVWEQANGHSLRSGEHVHHINGITDDNRPDNLVALTKMQHSQEHGTDTFANYRSVNGFGRDTVTCPVCGVRFTAFMSNHRIYCSSQCFGKARRKQPSS